MVEDPGSESEELSWLLLQQDGVISRRQIIVHLTPSRVDRLVRSGRWARPHRGIYVNHNGPLTSAQRTWVGVLAAGGGRRVPLAGLSALAAMGLRGIQDNLIHVLLPARMQDSNPPPHVVVHRTTYLPPSDHRPGLPPRTAQSRC